MIRVHRNIPSVALLDALRNSQERIDNEIRGQFYVKLELIQRQRDEMARHILSEPHGNEARTVRMSEYDKNFRAFEAQLMHATPCA